MKQASRHLRRSKKKVGDLIKWSRGPNWGWTRKSKEDTGVVVGVHADGFIDVLFGDNGIVHCIASDYDVIGR